MNNVNEAVLQIQNSIVTYQIIFPGISNKYPLMYMLFSPCTMTSIAMLLPQEITPDHVLMLFYWRILRLHINVLCVCVCLYRNADYMSAGLSQIHPDMMLQVSSLQLREGLVSLRVEAHTVSPHTHSSLSNWGSPQRYTDFLYIQCP